MTNPVGRPPKYNNPEDLQKAVDDFFDNPPKRKIYTNDGSSHEINVITITGLAIALGFLDRQSLYDYEVKDKFTCIIKKARLRVENDWEMDLKTKTQVTGAIFALKQYGWRDKTQEEEQEDINAPVVPVFFNVSEAVGDIKVTIGKDDK